MLLAIKEIANCEALKLVGSQCLELTQVTKRYLIAAGVSTGLLCLP
jgi:hypothetical protein